MTKTELSEIKGPIYLAAPYSHPEYTVRTARAQAADRAAAWLMEHTGCGVFSPITHGHPLAPHLDAHPHDWWMQQCKPLFHACRSLFVLATDTHATAASAGVAIELQWAQELGITAHSIHLLPHGGFTIGLRSAPAIEQWLREIRTRRGSFTHPTVITPPPESTAATPQDAPAAGRKDDAKKWRYSLMPPGHVEAVCQVLEFGARKYAPDNWQKVPDGKRRYLDAAMRHIHHHIAGQATDPESGLDHLAHASCSLAFAHYFQQHNTPHQPTPGVPT